MAAHGLPCTGLENGPELSVLQREVGEPTACSCAQHTPLSSSSHAVPRTRRAVLRLSSAGTLSQVLRRLRHTYCFGQINLSIWVVIETHTTSETRLGAGMGRG